MDVVCGNRCISGAIECSSMPLLRVELFLIYFGEKSGSMSAVEVRDYVRYWVALWVLWVSLKSKQAPVVAGAFGGKIIEGRIHATDQYTCLSFHQQRLPALRRSAPKSASPAT